MTDDPYLAMLEQRAAGTKAPPRKAERKAEGRPATPARGSDRALAFWQSPVVNEFIRRRITGDVRVSPAQRFAGLVGEDLRDGHALAVRAGDGKVESELLRHRACGRLTIVDTSDRRLEFARERIPPELADRVAVEEGDPLQWEPPGPLSLVVSQSMLHRVADPDAAVAHLKALLVPGGMVYVEEFVGPDRFQWSNEQIEIVNRLLGILPEELRSDLAGGDDEVKREIGRPDEERFARDHPDEAVASSRIRAALDAHLEPIDVRTYGGGIFHQLFARIMGNFSGRPELVRLILELDAILTDRGVVEPDYMWGAYRRAA